MRTGMIVVMLLCGGLAFAQQDEPVATGELAPWQSQLEELAFRLFRTSTINAINGLQFSRDQLLALRELALELEEAGAAPPAVEGTFREDLAEVREVFLELEAVLLEGEKVSEELNKKVLAARAKESAAIREGLTWNPEAPFGACSRCHIIPEPGARIPKQGEAFGKRAGIRAIPATAKKEQALSHMKIGLGEKAFMKLALLSRKVDRIMTDQQKALLSDFACCMIPPEDLGDQVRVGQAAVNSRTLKLLEDVRKIPDAKWPQSKRWLLAMAERLEVVKKPDATEAEKRASRDRVEKVYEKARSMSEIDFELSKEELCVELVGETGVEIDEKFQSFNAAFFLIGPGSVEVYDVAMARLADESRPVEPGELDDTDVDLPGPT